MYVLEFSINLKSYFRLLLHLLHTFFSNVSPPSSARQSPLRQMKGSKCLGNLDWGEWWLDGWRLFATSMASSVGCIFCDHTRDITHVWHLFNVWSGASFLVKSYAASSLRWSFMCFPAETMCCFQDGAVWDIAVWFWNTSQLPKLWRFRMQT